LLDRLLGPRSPATLRRPGLSRECRGLYGGPTVAAAAGVVRRCAGEFRAAGRQLPGSSPSHATARPGETAPLAPKEMGRGDSSSQTGRRWRQGVVAREGSTSGCPVFPHGEPPFTSPNHRQEGSAGPNRIEGRLGWPWARRAAKNAGAGASAPAAPQPPGAGACLPSRGKPPNLLRFSALPSSLAPSGPPLRQNRISAHSHPSPSEGGPQQHDCFVRRVSDVMLLV